MEKLIYVEEELIQTQLQTLPTAKLIFLIERWAFRFRILLVLKDLILRLEGLEILIALALSLGSN